MKVKCKKLNMTQIWKDEKVIPVTRVRVYRGDNNENKENADVFGKLKEGMKITVRGKSKGRGFQGVVKRHGFRGGPKSHGQKDRLRAPGSIGATAPQRVMKGRKMAGHMGTRNVTVRNVTVVGVDKEKSEVMVKGAVPGMRGAIIYLTLDH